MIEITTSTKQTIIYHLKRTPRTQERPRHLQNEQSSIIVTELPEHKKDHDIYKTNNHMIVRFVDLVVFLVFRELC
jgi:hypothetical protein